MMKVLFLLLLFFSASYISVLQEAFDLISVELVDFNHTSCVYYQKLKLHVQHEIEHLTSGG